MSVGFMLMGCICIKIESKDFNGSTGFWVPSTCIYCFHLLYFQLDMENLRGPTPDSV
jgi:hypothetical protein